MRETFLNRFSHQSVCHLIYIFSCFLCPWFLIVVPKDLLIISRIAVKCNTADCFKSCGDLLFSTILSQCSIWAGIGVCIICLQKLIKDCCGSFLLSWLCNFLFLVCFKCINEVANEFLTIRIV